MSKKFFALECNEEEAAVTNTDVSTELVPATQAELVPVAQAELETSSVEVVEQANEIEEIVTAIEEAAVDAETLADIQETMEGTLKDDKGLDETAAAIAEVAVEAICKRLGITKVSTEAYDDTSRTQYTKLAIEGVSDYIKSIWEAIKKAFKIIGEKIMDFIGMFLSSTDHIKKLADSLIAQAKEKVNADYKPVSGSVELGGAGSSIANGKDISLDSIDVVFNNHVAVTNNLSNSLNTIKKSATDLTSALVQFGKKQDTEDAALSKLLETDVQDMKNNLFKGVTPTKDVIYENDSINKVACVGPFVNGTAVYLDVKTKKDLIPTVRMGITTLKATPQISTIDALNSSECIVLCEKVKELILLTENYKKEQGKIKAINDDFVKVTEAGIKLANTIAGDDATGTKMKEMITSMGTYSKDANLVFTKYVTTIPSLNIKLCKAMLSVVNSNLKNLKK